MYEFINRESPGSPSHFECLDGDVYANFAPVLETIGFVEDRGLPMAIENKYIAR